MKAKREGLLDKVAIVDNKREGLLHVPYDRTISEESGVSQSSESCTSTDCKRILSSCSSQEKRDSASLSYDGSSQQPLLPSDTSNSITETYTEQMDDPASCDEECENSSIGFSDLSFYHTAHDGTLTESLHGCPITTHSTTTEGQSCSYPADTLSYDTNDESDDTLCDDIVHDSSTANDNTFADAVNTTDPADNSAQSDSPRKRVNSNGSNKQKKLKTSLTTKLGYVKIRPSRGSLTQNVRSSNRSGVYHSVNSHDGTVSCGSRYNSLTSLPTTTTLNSHCPTPRVVNLGRVCGGVYDITHDNHWRMAPDRMVKSSQAGSSLFTDDTGDEYVGKPSKDDFGVLRPLRRSVSTSPTHTFFAWEEVRLFNVLDVPLFIAIEPCGMEFLVHFFLWLYRQ